jgi:hypothetical protein
MTWKNRVLTNYVDLIDAITRVSSPEEAQEFMTAYREVNPHANENVGWIIGEVDRDVGRRIIEWFRCSHPVFGITFPTAEEAFRKGVEMGEAMKNGGVEAAKKYLRQNTNPWFLGALEK